MTELSDQRLLAAYCHGDRAAFDALYRRYAGRVHATALRMTGNWEDAEDTLQEVFIALAKKASSIRRGSALKSWIYRTAVNCATDCLRRRKPQVSLDASEPLAVRVIAVESLRRDEAARESSRSNRMLQDIERLIPRLPNRQAAVVVLRAFQGLRHSEIALALGCSRSSSKSHYSLAMGKLRRWIAEAAELESRANEKRGEPR